MNRLSKTLAAVAAGTVLTASAVAQSAQDVIPVGKEPSAQLVMLQLS